MSRCTAKIHQSSLGKHKNGMTIGKNIFVNLRFYVYFLYTFELIQPLHLYLMIKMPYVTHNGLILHLFHMLNSDDILVARCRHIYISLL